MTNWKTAGIKDLLADAIDRKYKWIDRNSNEDGPTVDYREWDEQMADFNEEIAFLAEGMVK